MKLKLFRDLLSRPVPGTFQAAEVFMESSFGTPNEVAFYRYGEKPDDFPFLYAYSPLHHLAKGCCYPPTLITTADHDDRVVPAHSFKFAATLQAAQSCDKPTLIRIETKAGHGAGKPTSKQIDSVVDKWSFLVRELKVKPDFSAMIFCAPAISCSSSASERAFG